MHLIPGTVKPVAFSLHLDPLVNGWDALGRAYTRSSLVQQQLANL